MKKAKIVKNKKEYKGIHKGERCFILGNGPSLNKTNLDLLRDEYTFGCNKLSLLYEKRNWHPSFYVMVSSDIYRYDWLLSANKNVELEIPCFFNSDSVDINSTTKSFFNDCKKLDHVYMIKSTGGRAGYPYPDEYWSNNPMETATKWGTILLTCIQLAAYMGFKEIYLLGCDLGFGPTTSNFDPKYNPIKYDPLGDIHSHEAHMLAKRMTENVGVKIFNASVGGALHVYPRKKLEELFV
jgi:hypothetical protein